MSKKKTPRIILDVSIPVIIMGLVSYFTDVSSEMITSILPFFIIQIGGDALILGVIGGTTVAISNIFKGVTGWISDKINKRKPFVVAGYTISNLSKPLMAFSPSWGYILALKTTDRFGKGVRTSARDSMISYYSLEKGRAFGLHRAMDTLGAVTGSFLAFLFLFFTWSFSQIILFSIFPGLIAIFLILSVKDIDPNQIDQTKLKYQGEKKVDKINKNFIKLISILGIIEFASVDIIFIQVRAENFTSFLFLIPLLYMMSNIVYTIFSPINGILSDKIGRKKVISTGLIVLLTLSIILAIPIQISIFSLILIILVFLMFGFYMASVDPISRAYVADLAGKNKAGRAYGAYYLSVGLISFFESIIFGFIYNISFIFAFIYVSIMLLISMLIFIKTDFSKILNKN
ncbi:MAG: MFS transporter [Promethearchaeota archaeon]